MQDDELGAQPVAARAEVRAGPFGYLHAVDRRHGPTPVAAPQNRCAPDGSLHAVAARGHADGQPRRAAAPGRTARSGAARWRSRAWIACLTAFRGRRRAVRGEGYSEIFFLDEATALAAGHRPCFECRRGDARAFAAAWGRAAGAAPPPRAPAMDRRPARRADRAAASALALAALPAGRDLRRRMAASSCAPSAGARRWSFAGYGPEREVDPAAVVAAVTPASVRAALAAGYRPMLHPRALS